MRLRWVEYLGIAFLALLLATIPLAHTTGLRNLLAGLLTVLALSWCASHKRYPGPTPLLFSWLALALVSAVWSLNAQVTQSEFLVSALLPVGCCWAAWLWIRDEARVTGMNLALLAGLLAILALRLAVLAADFQAVAPVQALYDTYWPGRGVASTLSILALSLAVWSFCRRSPWLGGATLILALTVGAQNWNRMFWLAALAAGLPAFLLAGKGGRRKWLCAITGLVVAVGGLAYSLRLKFPLLTWPEIAHQTLAKDERWAMWKQWAGVIAEKPLLGHGFGHKLVQQAGTGLLDGWVWDLAHAHNVLGNILVQLGLVGLAVYLSIIGYFLTAFVRALDRPAARPAAIAGISLIIGMLAKNMTDDFMQHASLVLFWTLIGMYSSLAGIGRKAA